MRSTKRISICTECGHKWTSYELEASQLDDLMRKAQADLLDEVQAVVDATRQRTQRGAICRLYGEPDDFANRGQGDEVR